MNKTDFKVYAQFSINKSPWTLKERVLILLWEICWALFCRWTPKPFNLWRLFWLRLFGAKINGMPSVVHQRARIAKPWNIILCDHSAVGDRAALYSLGIIEVKARATIAQEAYLCSATHDFSDPNMPLITAKITVGEDAFVGARAFVMPGVSIGNGALIGACSVVTKDVPAQMICAGNPCKPIKSRQIKK